MERRQQRWRLWTKPRDDVSVELLRNLEGLETFELEYWNDEAAARVELEDGAFRFLLVIPEGLAEAVQDGRPTGVRFVYDEGSITSAIVIGVISSFLDDVNFGLSNTAPLLNLSAEGIHAEDLDYFRFSPAGPGRDGSHDVLHHRTCLRPDHIPGTEDPEARAGDSAQSEGTSSAAWWWPTWCWPCCRPR